MSRSRPLSTIAALVPLVMPKCPLCAAGLFAALGIELRFMTPLTIALIIFPVAAIILRRTSVIVPIVAACGAAAAIAGRVIVDQPLLFHAGVLTVIGASIANAILAGRRCDRCTLTS